MLFDLQNPSRKRVIKVTYLILAVLMGGGLVLFGIGSGGAGGVVDAFTGGGGTDSATEQLQDDEKKFQDQIEKNPKNSSAWASLARTRVQLAGQGNNFDTEVTRSTLQGVVEGGFTEQGYKELQQAQQAWESYLALKPKQLDAGLAQTMATALGYDGLQDFQAAYRAQAVVAEANPSAGAFQTLALAAALASNTSASEIAKARALELTSKAQRSELKEALEQQEQVATQLSLTQQFQNQGDTTFPFESSSPLEGAAAR